MPMERIKSGIAGLDELLGGGFVKHRSTILAGGPGTGKTSMALLFLYHGASNGENGLFISFEEEQDKMIEHFETTFPKASNMRKMISQKKVAIVKKPPFFGFSKDSSGEYTEGLGQFIEELGSMVSKYKAQRVVIDSLSIMEMFFQNPIEYRKCLFQLTDAISKMGSTVILTRELPVSGREEMKFSIAEAVVDGIVALYNFPKGDKRIRAIEVVKMRGSKHSQNLAPLIFNENGIEVYPKEKVY